MSPTLPRAARVRVMRLAGADPGSPPAARSTVAAEGLGVVA